MNVAMNDEFVFWSEGDPGITVDGNQHRGHIYRVPRFGGSVELVADVGRTPEIAVDETSLYFADNYDSRIGRVPVSGGQPMTLTTTSGQAIALAVDRAQGAIYFTDLWGTGDASIGALRRVSLSGGTPTTLATGVNRGYDIAFDDAYVYYYSIDDAGPASLRGSLYSVRKDGASAPQVIDGDELSIASPLVAGGSLFWIAWAPGDAQQARAGLWSAPLSGGTKSLVTSNVVSGPSLAADDSYIYLATARTGITRVRLAGGDVEQVAPGADMDSPWFVAVDKSAVVWSTYQTGGSEIRIMCKP
jgi:hypothetical protein